MSPSPTSAPAVASLATIAETVHRATAPDHPAAFVSLADAPPSELSIGLWPIPANLGHPLLPLVGYVAPDAWFAVGITLPGRQHALGADASRPPTPTRTTLVRDRSGAVASVLGATPGQLRVITDAPVGFGADVVARTLGLPTPPPARSTAAFVEVTWLERVVGGLANRRSAGRSWRWLADRHPLRGAGAVPEPHELAAATERYALESPWGELRRRMHDEPLPAATWGPSGGSTLPLGAWFDDGSLARSILRQLPHPGDLLPQVLELLSSHVSADLLDALVEIDGTDRPEDWI